MLQVPIGGLLEARGQRQQAVLLEGAADKLQPRGQLVLAEPVGHRDGRNAGGGGRNLNHYIRASQCLIQAEGLLDGSLRFVGQMGVNFQAYVTIDAAGTIIRLPEQIGGHADIFIGKRFIDFLYTFVLQGQFLNTVIIIITARNGLFKNGRI